MVVTDDRSRQHPVIVLTPHRSDGEDGSPESHTVPVSLGLGRYTFDVTAHRLAAGELGIRLAEPAEQVAIRAQLEQARLNNAAAQQKRIEDANRRLAAIGLPSVGSRSLWIGATGPAAEVGLHDLTEDGRQAAVVWDDQPGTSLVPVGCVNARLGSYSRPHGINSIASKRETSSRTDPLARLAAATRCLQPPRRCLALRRLNASQHCSPLRVGGHRRRCGEGQGLTRGCLRLVAQR